jgi:hypothetical protein
MTWLSLFWFKLLLLGCQVVVVLAGLAMFKKMGYDEGFEDASQAAVYLVRSQEGGDDE